jgi:hypothetical protein
MRRGSNPQKKVRKIDLLSRHMVIIVVFIPDDSEYYKGVFDVFKTCLKSLQTTINCHARIMVVNNGCNKVATDFINSEFERGGIDTVIHHKENIGKMDALIGAARSCREELITITDTDILFTSGWQEAVEEVFNYFPNAGSVSPIPVQHHALFYSTYSLLFDIILRKVKFKKVEIPQNFDDYNLYLRSINWKSKNDKSQLWPIIQKDNVRAVISSGHQVMTVKRFVFLKYSPTNPSRSLVGNSEFEYGDEPTDKAGLWRLSTFHNFAYHMGNTLEDWMIKKLNQNKKNVIKQSDIQVSFNNQKNYNNNKLDTIAYKIKKKFVKKVFLKLYPNKLK